MSKLDLSANNIGIDLENFLSFPPVAAVAGPGGTGNPTATSFTTFNGGSTAFTDQVRGTFGGLGFTFDASNRPTGGNIQTATLSYRDVTFVDPGNVRVDLKTLAFTNVDNAPAAGITGISSKELLNRLLAKADEITGTRFNDNLYAGDGDDRIFGGDGDDRISGDNGNDQLDGGNGNDSLSGGANEDTLRGGAGDDTLSGGTGDDFLAGGTGSDTIDGGGGIDTVTYASAAGTVHLRLDTGTAVGEGSDRLVAIENAIGSTFYDSLFGNSGTNRLWGGGGDDYIDGLEGDDLLFGEAGNDTLIGGTGNDFLAGGDGADKLFGNDGRDTIEGGDGADQIDGGAGNDLLYGGAGDDFIFGGTGNDYLVGNAGNDRINGGAGANYTVGGAGNDIFVIPSYGSTAGPSSLQVEDFQDGRDRIDVSGLGLTAATLWNNVVMTQTLGGVGLAFTAGGISAANAPSIFLNGITCNQISAADFLF